MPRTPAELAALFQGTLEGAGPVDGPLTDVVTDSREVAPGSAFIALAGAAGDGHDHVGDAAARGAVMAVVDGRALGACPPLLLRVDDTGSALRRACTRRLAELGCTVVGISGSVGKTTVKEMCAHVLEGRLRVGRTLGNLNTWTGIPLSVLRCDGPVDVFVAELAMSARGEIRDLAGFSRPRLGVVLNVGRAHIGLLGSIEAIAAAKAELLEALPEDGVAVLNADDPLVVAMAPRTRASVVWFGLDGGAFSASDIESTGLAGVRFTLRTPQGTAPARLAMAGRHAVRDACATAAVAAQLGVGPAEVAERLETFAVPVRRGRVVVAREGALLYDDSYNSSPTSLEAALDVLESAGTAERIAVLGDMLELGDHAAVEHERAGRRAAAAATRLVAVGEHAGVMRDAAVAAGMEPEAASAVPDALAAARLVTALLDGGARRGRVAVLVKGSRAIGLDTVVEALTR